MSNKTGQLTVNESKQILLKLQKDEAYGYKNCIECNAPYPQWASIPYGIMFCLECSGVHRSLGVHISFVRSITMDNWNVDQIKKMEMGGNKKANDFFKSQPEWRDKLSIVDKYNSEMAKNYKDKLAADCEGRVWVQPPPGSSSSRQSANKSQSSISSSDFNSNDQKPKAVPPNFALPTKVQNEEYFSRLGALNDARPSDLPPSQGGKYVGFGNTPDEPSQSIEDDPLKAGLATLSKGWSIFAAVAMTGFTEGTKLAKTGVEVVQNNIIKPASEAVRADPQMNSLFNTIGQKVNSGMNTIVAQGSDILSSTGLTHHTPGTFQNLQGIFGGNQYAELGDGLDDNGQFQSDNMLFDPTSPEASNPPQTKEEKKNDWDSWKQDAKPVPVQPAMIPNLISHAQPSNNIPSKTNALDEGWDLHWNQDTRKNEEKGWEGGW